MAEIKIEKCPLCGADIEKTTVEKEGNKIYIDCKEEFKRKRWISCSEQFPANDEGGLSMTNLERLQNMSADELAAIIKICPCEEKGIECDHDSCYDCRVDWLYEEADQK